MAIFPKIQNPCPYIAQLSAFMEGDTCRMCKRQVFDLSDMSDGERAVFLRGCSGEVCVSYKVPAAIAAALAIAAVVTPVAASAQDAVNVEEIVVTVGGIKDVANIEYIQDADDTAIADLPVVYDDAPATDAAMVAAVVTAGKGSK